jgi:signal peptidase II
LRGPRAHPGGALGNLYDRMVYGHVVDFLDSTPPAGTFRPSTFADSAITVGAGILILESFMHREGAE